MEESKQQLLPVKPASGYGGQSFSVGLSTAEAEALLAEYGPNELDAAEQESFFMILITQMGNLIFLLTALAAAICFATGDSVKGTFLVCLVCIVCIINAIGEYSGQDASSALKAMEPEASQTVRDGTIKEVPVAKLVIGDVVHVKIGDVIPADMEVTESVDLQLNESSLTGEPEEKNKSTELKDPSANQKSNMLYKNTEVVGGRGVGKVTATGMRTEIGLIAKRLKGKSVDAESDPEEEQAKGVFHYMWKGLNKMLGRKTEAQTKLNPLQHSINQLGTIIMVVCAVVICVGMLCSFAFRYQSLPPVCALHDDWRCIARESVIRGLLMAVGIIPHGLPLVVMVMLRIGSQLMADRNAVVTKQSAVDYLGATQVICTDKTGTLTQGKMAATQVISLIRDKDNPTNGKEEKVKFYPLCGLNPVGGVYDPLDLTEVERQKMDKAVEKGVPVLGPKNLCGPEGVDSPCAALARASTSAAFLGCHKVKILPPESAGMGWTCKDNMTEAALRVAAWKAQLTENTDGGKELLRTHEQVTALDVTFTSARKMSATVHRLAPGGRFASFEFGDDITHIAIVKGSPAKLIPLLTHTLVLKDNNRYTVATEKMTEKEKNTITEQNGNIAAQAWRALVMAVRPLSAADVQQLESKTGDDLKDSIVNAPDGPLAFLCLWGIFDPPRATVPGSIREAHEAGIDVVMITGDQRPTAVAIGKEVGILEKDMTEEETLKHARVCKDLHRGVEVQDLDVDARPAKKGSLRTIPIRRMSSAKISTHDSRGEKDSHENEYKDAEEINPMVSKVKVWAVAQPTDKVTIVESFTNQEYVAAMTGDGVNDAPALKIASVGVAMGISGTNVTKQSANLILMDDNFSTIVAAVKEGRKIYINVQKYVLFNLSMKGSEAASILIAIILDLPLPIQGLQQLVNMVVTHIIPPMAIAYEDAEKYTMKIKPRETKNDLVVNRLHMLGRWLPFVIIYALLMTLSNVLFVWMHTGFVHVHALIGSTNPNAITMHSAACLIAGNLDANGVFMEDPAPYHCTCYVREHPFQAHATTVDQWGRPDLYNVHVNRYTGSTGDALQQENTPWAGTGESDYLEECYDTHHNTHMCWRDPAVEKPLLSGKTNCAEYGALIGESMTYMAIQVGEVLALVTFRTDDPFWSARFSKTYTAALVMNLCVLFVVLYVAAVADLLSLAPLTPLNFMMALFVPIALVMLNELIKVDFRYRQRAMHALESPDAVRPVEPEEP